MYYTLPGMICTCVYARVRSQCLVFLRILKARIGVGFSTTLLKKWFPSQDITSLIPTFLTQKSPSNA